MVRILTDVATTVAEAWKHPLVDPQNADFLEWSSDGFCWSVLTATWITTTGYTLGLYMSSDIEIELTCPHKKEDNEEDFEDYDVLKHLVLHSEHLGFTKITIDESVDLDPPLSS
jgi:hypothetical protein